MDQTLFDKGRRMREAVLGAGHVARARDPADAFDLPFQDFATEYAWGAIWSRPGLDLRARSLRRDRRGRVTPPPADGSAA